MKLLLVFGFLAFLNRKDCLNLYAVDASGKQHLIQYEWFQIYENNDFKSYYKSQLEVVEKKIKSGNQKDNLYFQKLSDYSVYLTKVGYYKEALEMFQFLIKKYPNEYTINSNLGTLYELNGKNDSALKYIEKSLILNPCSHYGSEWLHINILKAKILPNIDISQVKFIDSLALDENSSNNNKIDQVFHQLEERLRFSKVGDLYVAKIFEELADVYYQKYSIKYALLYYTIAYEYSNRKWNRIEEKIKVAKLACKKAEQNSDRKDIRRNGMQPYDSEIEIQRLRVEKNVPLRVDNLKLIDYKSIFEKMK